MDTRVSRGLQDAAHELVGDDVAFVGIDTRDSGQAQGLAFRCRYDVSDPSLFDPADRTRLAFRGKVDPAAIPSTVVLDEEGKVAATIIGEVRGRRTLVDPVEDIGS